MYTESAPPDWTNRQPFWLPAPDGFPVSNCSPKVAVTSVAVASVQGSGAPPAGVPAVGTDVLGVDGAVVVDGLDAPVELDEHAVTASAKTTAATQRRATATADRSSMIDDVTGAPYARAVTVDTPGPIRSSTAPRVDSSGAYSGSIGQIERRCLMKASIATAPTSAVWASAAVGRYPRWTTRPSDRRRQSTRSSGRHPGSGSRRRPAGCEIPYGAWSSTFGLGSGAMSDMVGR